MSRKCSPLVRRYAADRGWHLLSLYQPHHLFRANGRRLSRVAEPGDPWQAIVGDEPDFLTSTITHGGVADTADDAVLAAVPRGDLRRSLTRLEIAVDNLRDCLQK